MNFDRMYHNEFVGLRDMYSFLCITGVEEWEFPKSQNNLHKKLCSITGHTMAKQWFIPLFPLRLSQ